jgi:hypothetical protein
MGSTADAEQPIGGDAVAQVGYANPLPQVLQAAPENCCGHSTQRSPVKEFLQVHRQPLAVLVSLDAESVPPL